MDTSTGKWTLWRRGTPTTQVTISPNSVLRAITKPGLKPRPCDVARALLLPAICQLYGTPQPADINDLEFYPDAEHGLLRRSVYHFKCALNTNEVKTWFAPRLI